MSHVQAAAGKISEQLMQRLRLKPEKIKQLGAGLRSIAAQDEPIGKTLSRLEIAQGLELEKVCMQQILKKWVLFCYYPYT